MVEVKWGTHMRKKILQESRSVQDKMARVRLMEDVTVTLVFWGGQKRIWGLRSGKYGLHREHKVIMSIIPKGK